MCIFVPHLSSAQHVLCDIGDNTQMPLLRLRHMYADISFFTDFENIFLPLRRMFRNFTDIPVKKGGVFIKSGSF